MYTYIHACIRIDGAAEGYDRGIVDTYTHSILIHVCIHTYMHAYGLTVIQKGLIEVFNMYTCIDGLRIHIFDERCFTRLRYMYLAYIHTWFSFVYIHTYIVFFCIHTYIHTLFSFVYIHTYIHGFLQKAMIGIFIVYKVHTCADVNEIKVS